MKSLKFDDNIICLTNPQLGRPPLTQGYQIFSALNLKIVFNQVEVSFVLNQIEK